MNLPTADRPTPFAAVIGDGSESLCAVLEVPFYEPMFCERCLGQSLFVFEVALEAGYLGQCTECGDLEWKEFTRSVGE